MKRALILSALVLAQPALARPKASEPVDPAGLPVPATWPKGEAYALASDAALPAYAYQDVLGDPRLVLSLIHI